MKCLSPRLFPILLLLASCHGAPPQQPDVRVVRIVTVLGRLTTPLADALTKVLPDHFPARVEIQKTATTKDYVDMLIGGTAELAIVQTNIAYTAYTQGLADEPQPQRRLRGIALLYRSPIHLIARKDTGIQNLSDLRGKRVFVGTDGNTAELTTRMILDGVGISVAERTMPETEVGEALRRGDLDAAFVRGNDPSPNVQRVMKNPGVFLVPIGRTDVEKIREHHPFLRPTSIAAGLYGNESEIQSVGTDMLLACRDDLPDELVYWITRTLFESLPDLAESYSLLRQVDLQQLSASPIPLHPGAARFYRERELLQ